MRHTELDGSLDASACQSDVDMANARFAPSPSPATLSRLTTQQANNLAESRGAALARAFDLRQRTSAVHNGANDATECVRVEVTGTRVEWGSTGKMRMVNTCSYPVAVLWCANTQQCETTPGNLQTINAGQEWPIFFSDPENPDVRLGACRIGAQAVAAVGPNGTFTSDHRDPAPGAPAGVRAWTRNTCD